MRTKLHSNFQRQKIDRYLTVHGTDYTFIRYPKGEYEELNRAASPHSIRLRGLFYTQNNQKGFWMLNEFDETRVRYKRYLTSFIIVRYEDHVLDPIKLDDEVDVNGQAYRVTGVTNVQEDNFAVNISLDLIV